MSYILALYSVSGTCVTVTPLRFCPNWSDWGQKKSSVNLRTDLPQYLCCIFCLALLFLLPPLSFERDSCFLPGCPISITLISPFNYSCHQPPNTSLSPLGVSEKWKGNAGSDGRQGAHQWGYGETGGCSNMRPLPVHQWHCQLASLPAGQLMLW